MIKKILTIALATLMLLSLAACGGAPEGDPVTSSSGGTVTTPEQEPTPASEQAPAPEPEPAPTTPEQVDNMEITLQLSLLGNPAAYTGTYTGETVDGLPHGQGSFATTNVLGKSRTYIGGWDAGHLSGEGRWEHSTGRIVAEGIYENDLLTSGKLYYGNDQIRYEGAFRNGLPDMDAAAIQARIDDYNEVAVHRESGGDWDWADHIDQMVVTDVTLAEVVQDVAAYVCIYDNDVGSNNYYPAYGEPIPQPGDRLRIYQYAYAEVTPETGETTIFQDVLAYVVQ